MVYLKTILFLLIPGANQRTHWAIRSETDTQPPQPEKKRQTAAADRLTERRHTTNAQIIDFGLGGLDQLWVLWVKPHVLRQ